MPQLPTFQWGKMMKLPRKIYLLLLVLPCQSTMAWVEGQDYDIELACNRLPMAEAKSIIVRVMPKGGSFGQPSLVGIKNGEVQWVHRFPKIDEVNTASLEASCNGGKIRLAYRYPMGEDWVVNDFIWNGEAIKFSGTKITKNYASLDIMQ